MAENPTVLIVDDEPVNVKLLEGILAKEGFNTLRASNGPDARELATNLSPDLILLDIMMPGESGFETCSMLKMNHPTEDIPVIFISAIDAVKDKVKGLTIGAVDYITKPFEKAEVIARARIHIRLKQAYSLLIQQQSLKLTQLKEAQQAMLTRPEDCQGARFAVCYQPRHEAGGDFYDVVQCGDGIFGYFVADVSGHDLSASFTTSALKALIKQNSSPLYTPQETMKMVNGVMCSVLTDEQFLTACYAHLNRNRSELTIINAGHTPVVYLPLNGSAEVIYSSGDPVGIFTTPSFDFHQRKVVKGDRFFLYTDGVVEDFGERKKKWKDGIEELKQICVRTTGVPLPEAVEKIIGSIYPDRSYPQDDLVLLGVEV
jgi:phosphoserine phosphatase RsbU/P